MQRFIIRISLFLSMAAIGPLTASGQFLNQAIGGVSIDATGQISSLAAANRVELANDLRQRLKTPPADLGEFSDARVISLRSLEAQLASHLNENQPLPEEVQCLAGLQRVEYIFVDMENHDVLLAGPAEGWTVSDTGDVVGITTGMPVLLLDDLIVALRTVKAAAQVGITCSIDPTTEGRQALSAMLKRQKQFAPGITRAIEQALGPQKISLTGVPDNSHFAQVLVAGDYRMKRLAMNLEPAPIDGMPSFLDLIKSRGGGLNNMMPRWWMACNYDSIARSEDRLTWQLRGQGVKVMTEDQLVSVAGDVAQTGKVNPLAQLWADTMTSRFNDLSRREPIFGQVRNLMDLCVAAALIEKESLLGKANLALPLLTGDDGRLDFATGPTPKWVASQSSFIKKGSNYIITASGGVHVDSWQVVENQQVVPQLRDKRNLMAPAHRSGWRW